MMPFMKGREKDILKDFSGQKLKLPYPQKKIKDIPQLTIR